MNGSNIDEECSEQENMYYKKRHSMSLRTQCPTSMVQLTRKSKKLDACDGVKLGSNPEWRACTNARFTFEPCPSLGPVFFLFGLGHTCGGILEFLSNQDVNEGLVCKLGLSPRTSNIVIDVRVYQFFDSSFCEIMKVKVVRYWHSKVWTS